MMKLCLVSVIVIISAIGLYLGIAGFLKLEDFLTSIDGDEDDYWEDDNE